MRVGGSEDLRVKFWLGPVILLGGAIRNALGCRAGDLSSNPGPGENFSLKSIMKHEPYVINSKRRFMSIKGWNARERIEMNRDQQVSIENLLIL